MGGYRTGSFVLDFQYDYDPENGVGVSNLIADFGDYLRTRGEVTVGVSPIPGFDIHAGGRWESLRIGGATIFGNPVSTDLNVDHQAIVVGARAQTASWRPFGWYLLGRRYLGSAKFDRAGLRVNSDTSGYRAETAVPVALGDSAWFVVPGLEYERIRTQDSAVRWTTNRFCINFLHSSRR